MANLFRYVHTYDRRKSLANWIFICCKRLIFDLDHRREAFKTTDDLDPEHIVSHYAEDMEHVSGNCMGMRNYREFYNDDILRALRSLNPIYREALLLQQAGYKLEEIMEIALRRGTLSTRNIETVKSRLFLAKQKMRQLIDRDGNSAEIDQVDEAFTLLVRRTLDEAFRFPEGALHAEPWTTAWRPLPAAPTPRPGTRRGLLRLFGPMP